MDCIDDDDENDDDAVNLREGGDGGTYDDMGMEIPNTRHEKATTSDIHGVDNGHPDQASLVNNDTNWGIVLGVVCAGLYPQVVRLGRFKEKAKKTAAQSSSSRSSQHHRPPVQLVQETIKLVQHDQQEVTLHPSSLLSRYVTDILNKQKEENALDAFLVYYKKVVLYL